MAALMKYLEDYTISFWNAYRTDGGTVFLCSSDTRSNKFEIHRKRGRDTEISIDFVRTWYVVTRVSLLTMRSCRLRASKMANLARTECC